MAPEQLEGKDSGGRADIFAFGAVLDEMMNIPVDGGSVPPITIVVGWDSATRRK